MKLSQKKVTDPAAHRVVTMAAVRGVSGRGTCLFIVPQARGGRTSNRTPKATRGPVRPSVVKENRHKKWSTRLCLCRSWTCRACSVGCFNLTHPRRRRRIRILLILCGHAVSPPLATSAVWTHASTQLTIFATMAAMARSTHIVSLARIAPTAASACSIVRPRLLSHRQHRLLRLGHLSIPSPSTTIRSTPLQKRPWWCHAGTS